MSARDIIPGAVVSGSVKTTGRTITQDPDGSWVDVSEMSFVFTGTCNSVRRISPASSTADINRIGAISTPICMNTELLSCDESTHVDTTTDGNTDTRTLILGEYATYPTNTECNIEIVELHNDGDTGERKGPSYSLDCRGMTFSEVNHWIAAVTSVNTCVGENGKLYSYMAHSVTITFCPHTKYTDTTRDEWYVSDALCIGARCAAPASVMFRFDPRIHAHAVIGMFIGQSRVENRTRVILPGHGIFAAILALETPLCPKIRTLPYRKWELFLCHAGDDAIVSENTHATVPIVLDKIYHGVVGRHAAEEMGLCSTTKDYSWPNKSAVTHGDHLDRDMIKELSKWIVDYTLRDDMRRQSHIQNQQRHQNSRGMMRQIWSAMVARVITWTVRHFLSEISK